MLLTLSFAHALAIEKGLRSWHCM